MVLDLLQSMPAGKIIGIHSVRKKNHLDVESLLQNQVDSTQCGLYSGTVTVIDDGDVVGELADEPDLFDRKRCSAGCNDIGDTQLVHREHVKIALNKDTLVLTRNFILGEIDSVQRPALHIDLRFLGIHVFRDGLVGLESSATESDHSAADRMYREDHAVMECVHHPAVVIFLAQAGIEEVLFLVSR